MWVAMVPAAMPTIWPRAQRIGAMVSVAIRCAPLLSRLQTVK